MTLEEFNEKYVVVFGEPTTTDSGTAQVAFNQIKAFIKNRITGEVFETKVQVNSDSQEIGELLAIQEFIKTSK